MGLLLTQLRKAASDTGPGTTGWLRWACVPCVFARGGCNGVCVLHLDTHQASCAEAMCSSACQPIDISTPISDIPIPTPVS
jgi:hypothetical protein